MNGKTVHSSDVRLKAAVAPLGKVLDNLDRINGVSFLRCDSSGTPGGGDRQIGVIAQDVQAVFPELVTVWDSDNH